MDNNYEIFVSKKEKLQVNETLAGILLPLIPHMNDRTKRELERAIEILHYVKVMGEDENNNSEVHVGDQVTGFGMIGSVVSESVYDYTVEFEDGIKKINRDNLWYKKY